MSKPSEQEGVTGTLSQGLEQAYEGLKQGPSSTTLFWVGGAVAVALVIGLFWWFWSSSDIASSARTRALQDIIFPAQVEAFLANPEHRDTVQYRLAQFRKARMDLAVGIRNLGDNIGSVANAAREQVADAVKTYTALTKVSGLVPTLQMEANLGAAKGHEALGEYKEAIEFYKKLASDYKDTEIGKQADKKVSLLKDEANQTDLKRLAETFGPRKEARPN
jgi:hypothetical protein